MNYIRIDTGALSRADLCERCGDPLPTGSDQKLSRLCPACAQAVAKRCRERRIAAYDREHDIGKGWSGQ